MNATQLINQIRSGHSIRTVIKRQVWSDGEVHEQGKRVITLFWDDCLDHLSISSYQLELKLFEATGHISETALGVRKDVGPRKTFKVAKAF